MLTFRIISIANNQSLPTAQSSLKVDCPVSVDIDAKNESIKRLKVVFFYNEMIKMKFKDSVI